MPPRKKKELALVAPVGGAPSLPPELQRWVTRDVHRSQLLNAPYNPRFITPAKKKKLLAGIKKLGLLAPPTWNVRTGNIVGGHRRMEVIDAIMGTADYRLNVAEVDLSETEEREANLLLNNDEAAGETDQDKLVAMFNDSAHPLRLEATGYDIAEVYRLGGMDTLAQQETEKIAELADKLADSREKQLEMEAGFRARDNNAFYTVLVFRDAEQASAFHRSLQLDADRFQDGQSLLQGLLEHGFQPPGGSPDEDA